MLQTIHPKLPMRNKTQTRSYYVNQLGFRDISASDYEGYLILSKDQVELHFFEFKELKPSENYGQVYIRTKAIEELYQSLLNKGVPIHPQGPLEDKPWGQKEFSLLDPDNNLLTFGQRL